MTFYGHTTSCSDLWTAIGLSIIGMIYICLISGTVYTTYLIYKQGHIGKMSKDESILFIIMMWGVLVLHALMILKGQVHL